MQATIEKNTTDKLRDEHRAYVAAIDSALSGLEIALTNEQDFRRRCQCDEPAFFANCPALKFSIKFTTNKSKPFQFCTEWRRWVCGCNLLAEERQKEDE